MQIFKDVLNVQIHHEIVINICSTEKWLRVTASTLLHDTKHPWVISVPPQQILSWLTLVLKIDLFCINSASSVPMNTSQWLLL